MSLHTAVSDRDYFEQIRNRDEEDLSTRHYEAQREADWRAFVGQIQRLYVEYCDSWPAVIADLQRQIGTPECGGIFAAFANDHDWPETVAALSTAMRETP
jgi:hypothetical protein